jgi:uncharacterized protein (DUF1778 family)
LQDLFPSAIELLYLLAVDGLTKCIDIVWTKHLNKKSIITESAMYTPTSEESVNQTRDVTINIRAKQNQRDLIDQAAEVQGKSRSEFMLESAYQKAQDVLLDRTFFGLDELKFQQFTALLDARPVANEKLKAMLNTKAPWE